MSSIKSVAWLIILASTMLALQSCGGSDSSLAPYPLVITSIEMTAFHDANHGVYSRVVPLQLTAKGGAPKHGYTWSLKSGTVSPIPGMKLDPETGVVSGGVPPDSGGTKLVCPGAGPSGIDCGLKFTFEVTSSDGVDSVTQKIEINSYDCDSSLSVQPDCLASGGTVVVDYNQQAAFQAADEDPYTSVGDFILDLNRQFASDRRSPAPVPAGIPFGYTLSASGGTPPYMTWHMASGSLPPGLSLDAERGVIWGTPDADDAGKTYMFSVGVADSAGNFSPAPKHAFALFSLTISDMGYQSPPP